MRRIRFLVGLRPGFVLPAVAAQRAATLLQIAGPRLAFGVLAGTDTAEHRTYGDVVNHDDRFARAGEFLQVLAQAWKGRGAGGGFAHEGAHYRIDGGGLYRPPAEPLPPLYIGGGTPAAERVAAVHAQVYYHWAAAPAIFAARLRRVADLAAAEGRNLRFGVRAHLVARETEALARRELDRVSFQSPRVASAAEIYYEVSPGLWTAAGSGRAILVGSHAQVAARLETLHGLGADSFILSADDALDDPLRIAEEVLPLVRAARPAATAPTAP
ncbi:MAG: Alkanesulfonate monooxygenase [Xylophilus sp.]|nr:MAG: Alkanesulfonate monooxygenase [Xylophilus sp.]